MIKKEANKSVKKEKQLIYGKRINFIFCMDKRVFFVSEQAFPSRKEKFDFIKYVQGKIVSK